VEQVGIVEGMHPGERRAGAPGLVALQMPDEVPGDGQIARGLGLAERLLDLVLAEVALAGIPCRAYGRRVERLGDGDQADRVRRPARPPGSCSDAGANRREVGGDPPREAFLTHSCGLSDPSTPLACSANCP